MRSRIASMFVFVFVLVFVFALWSSVAAAPDVTIQPSRYARLGSLTAAEATSLGNIAPAAMPNVTIRASHYARLGSLTAAEAANLGFIAPAVSVAP
jgi:hypothetical protein